MIEQFTPARVFLGPEGKIIAYTTDGTSLVTGQVFYSPDHGETTFRLLVIDYYGTATRHSFMVDLNGRRVLLSKDDHGVITQTDNHTHTRFRLSPKRIILNKKS